MFYLLLLLLRCCFFGRKIHKTRACCEYDMIMPIEVQIIQENSEKLNQSKRPINWSLDKRQPNSLNRTALLDVVIIY